MKTRSPPSRMPVLAHSVQILKKQTTKPWIFCSSKTLPRAKVLNSQVIGSQLRGYLFLVLGQCRDETESLMHPLSFLDQQWNSVAISS